MAVGRKNSIHRPFLPPECRFSKGRDPSGLSFSEPWDPRPGGFSEAFPPHVTPRYILVRPLLGPGGVHGLSRGHDAEVKEVLRLWLGGAAHKRIAAPLGLNVKTVRRYVAAARASGVVGDAGPEALDDGLIAAVVSRVRPHLGRPRGDGWADCAAQRALIERFLRQGVRLSKLRKLLRR